MHSELLVEIYFELLVEKYFELLVEIYSIFLQFGSWWYYLRLTFHGLEVHRFDLNGKFGGKATGLKFALPGIKLPGMCLEMWNTFPVFSLK